MTVLTDGQIDTALTGLDGWKHSGGTLNRTVTFSSFLQGIDAVRRVSECAEVKDHHPDIDIRWRTVHFALVTHSQGGITDKDIAMAGEINRILAA